MAAQLRLVRRRISSVQSIAKITRAQELIASSRIVKAQQQTRAAEPYARYQSFFQDQQNVLAYQSQKLQEYLHLTERRSVRVYDTVRRSNVFLIVWGSAFLLATLVLTILAAVWPHRVSWTLPAVTGGLSLGQFAGPFQRVAGEHSN